jgi:hypothetical protein
VWHDYNSQLLLCPPPSHFLTPVSKSAPAQMVRYVAPSPSDPSSLSSLLLSVLPSSPSSVLALSPPPAWLATPHPLQGLTKRLFSGSQYQRPAGSFRGPPTLVLSHTEVDKITSLISEAFGDVDYGGRVTDDKDQRTLWATLTPLLRQALDRPLMTVAPAEVALLRRGSSAHGHGLVDREREVEREEGHRVPPMDAMVDGLRPWDMECFLAPTMSPQNPLQVRACPTGCCALLCCAVLCCAVFFSVEPHPPPPTPVILC